MTRNRTASVIAAMVAFSTMRAICAGSAPQDLSQDAISRVSFGRMPDGAPVALYKLRNRNGMEATITTYGGILTQLIVPDREGRRGDVVLGFDTLQEYLKSKRYFGALIGRYGNRIARARFTLNGASFSLAANNGPNALHGGVVGFDKVVWTALRAGISPEGPRIALTHMSRDSDEGYPGNLHVKAVYTLTDDNTLRLEYTASTDKITVVNLTQHSYFNLRGRGDILGHIVRINAEQFTPVDSTQIPTGELRPVRGTPFDFLQPTAIGDRINGEDEQLLFGKGYDINYVINKPPGALAVMATVYEPESGRVLEVSSTEPGLQFYTGNFLDGSATGKGGWVYTAHSGLCMEPQHFPDSPNEPRFPTTVLQPGRVYRNTIIYRFSAQ